MNHFSSLLSGNYLIMDGGFGTELMKKGLRTDEPTQLAVFSHPDWVEEVSRSYARAGSMLVMADSFGANRVKLAGTGHTVRETIFEAVRLARNGVRGTDCLVGLDISTPGVLLEPAGPLSYEEAYDIFREVAVLGEEAGADVICLETFTDLQEIRLACLAAKEHTKLPVTASMTFDENGRSLSGATAASFAVTLTAAGADAVGVNCALGPDKLKTTVGELLEFSGVPVIVKPNAGLPDPNTGVYTLSAADFARDMAEFYRNGVTLLGGCCGTTPAHIRALAEALQAEKAPVPRKAPTMCVLSGTGKTVRLNAAHMVGERINPTGKKAFADALRAGDIDYAVARALEQVAAGAEILDVNVGVSGIDEKETMRRVVTALSSAVSVPLMLDSTSPAVLEAGLLAATGKCIVNSVNAKEESLATVLPLIQKYGAAVVGLTLDENGIPETAAQRVALAKVILERAESLGIPRTDVLIDCLTMSVSTNPQAANITLDALHTVTEECGVGTVLGVSNVSFGLPCRPALTASFLTRALECGLTLPIVNPNLTEITNAFYSYRLLHGMDEGARAYIAHAVKGEAAPAAASLTLFEAIYRGMKEEAARLTKAALKSTDSGELVNGILIPSLDKVGKDFEAGTLFLPQLILAADAAGSAFSVIKEALAAADTPAKSKGKVLLATVHGDVHDIGKNIVGTVLENYGFTVVDLGKDVPAERIVRGAFEENAGLVGLSALMTTTLPAMRETVRALKDAGYPGKIMVGGAVLTPEFASEIGADYYAHDAKQSADIAKAVFA